MNTHQYRLRPGGDFPRSCQVAGIHKASRWDHCSCNSCHLGQSNRRRTTDTLQPCSTCEQG